MNQHCDNYVMADEVFNSIGMGFLVPKNAPYTEAVSFKYVKTWVQKLAASASALIIYYKIQITSNFKRVPDKG